MPFRASFCDPFKADIIEIGSVEQDNVLALFDKIPWADYLEKMETTDDDEVFYSPSLEIENTENKNGLAVSPIDGTEWYIFFKRPKQVKRFFGLSTEMNDGYLSDVTGQTENDVRECLKALLNNDLQFLEDKIK